jgi:hypothetical protein
MSSQTIEDMISTLLVEEKRTIVRETKGDTQHETSLYPRYNCSKLAKDKWELECHYCKKRGHIAWHCSFQANDVLKGKLKYKPHVANIVVVEDSSYANSGDDLTKEMTFYAF